MSISKFNTTENKTKIQEDGKVIILSYSTHQKLLITLSITKYSKIQIVTKTKISKTHTLAILLTFCTLDTIPNNYINI